MAAVALQGPHIIRYIYVTQNLGADRYTKEYLKLLRGACTSPEQGERKAHFRSFL